MVKTRIMTIPELVEHLDIQIDGVNRSLINYHATYVPNSHDTVVGLKSELRVLKDIRNMLIC